MLVVRAFLVTRDDNVGIMDDLGHNAIKQLNPDEFILLSRNGLARQPIQRVETFPA